MTHLLLIDTSAAACTAAVCDDNGTIAARAAEEPRSQASGLAPLIKELLSECGLTVAGLDGVAVCGGPGSYTGLRVGVSTAKGVCFGADRPLLSVRTTELLTYQAIETLSPAPDTLIIPMIDARRMEVYTQPFDGSGKPLGEISAVILDENSFTAEAERHNQVIFIGDGAAKYEAFLHGAPAGGNAAPLLEKSRFINCCPDASFMRIPAMERLRQGKFEDVAYYEPFYLKDFVAGISRKPVLF